MLTTASQRSTRIDIPHASARNGPEFDHIDPAKEGQGIKLQFHGMNIG